MVDDKDSRSSEVHIDESVDRVDLKRRGSPSVEDLLTKEVITRADRANEHLRGKVRGTILVKVRGQDSFLVDGTKTKFSVEKSSSNSADAVIEVAEQDLLRISSGYLNPQIAMLSDKVTIAGNAELAIYFFNLIAPS